MPCYQVRTISVDFKVGNEDLLKKAAEKLNWKYRERGNLIEIKDIIILDLRMQTASFPKKCQDDLNLLKRTYSEVCIEEIAKKKRWSLKRKNNKLEMKRY